MDVTLLIRRSLPPFSPLAEILSATNVDRLRPHDRPGQMVFNYSINEELGDLLAAGAIISDHSDQGIKPWLWTVERISRDLQEGMLEVECSEMRQVLYERTVPLRQSTAGSLSGGTVARILLQASNARNPTHLPPAAAADFASLRRLLPSVVTVGGQSLGAALDLLALQSDSEWYLDYQVDWNKANPVIRWTDRRGSDRRNEVQLQEGVHLSGASWVGESIDSAQAVTFVGSGDTVDSKPAATTVLKNRIAPYRNLGGLVQASDERTSRALSLVAGTNKESLEVLPDQVTERGLQVASAVRLARPISPSESLGLTVNDRIGWGDFDLGDVVTVRLPSFGGDLAARVTAMQPDEAVGLMELVLEAQS